MTGRAATIVELGRAEAMRLLAGADFGRVVFTKDALPAIRPVNHLVDGDTVIIRTRLATEVGRALHTRPRAEFVVAYEADEIDGLTRSGWSVVVTGLARAVTDPRLVAAYTARLRPWVNTDLDTVIAIEPTIVTGIRLRPGPGLPEFAEPRGKDHHPWPQI
ncbi:pyridoxamine 5'-phosphate oxidase family protein [Nocardia thailandica]|uniref:Pyridoxamine 5'-phosphate oxidase family protein n=1 Tax=Nocardia thailandica TaxID=257275 RepID=A0ABW6PRG2_9NOCA|nr:pyridoxamine 5'-phosphate oxidase family protein [Nocardia thailandica]